MYGGRAGLKSWACAQALILHASDTRVSIVCAREIQKSIRESVHQLLCDTIKRLNLLDEWEIQNDRLLQRRTGSKINFIGLHNNTHNLKSYEGTDICWVEEAQAVTEKSWTDLGPTIRKPGSEIWVTYNPDDELDPTHVRFVGKPRENSWVIKTSWRDAEDKGWFPDELRLEMLQMKEENYKQYLHVWEGEANSNYEDAIIQPEWVEAALDAHLALNWEPLGERIASFDPADTGDEKAVAVRHGFLIDWLGNWNNGELPDAIKKCYRVSFEQGAGQLVFDGDGLGASMKIGLDQHEREYKIKANSFRGGASPDDPDVPYPPILDHSKLPDRIVTNKDMFRNKRAQYYWFLKDRFEKTYNAIQNNSWVNPDECISISSNIPEEIRKDLRRQLTRIRRKRGANSSQITLESKEDMKKAGIKSPGLADCLMMVFANSEAFGNSLQNFKMRPIC
jgi:phage terminase large subunit